jgi:hypothetical protein
VVPSGNVFEIVIDCGVAYVLADIEIPGPLIKLTVSKPTAVKKLPGVEFPSTSQYLNVLFIDTTTVFGAVF